MKRFFFIAFAVFAIGCASTYFEVGVDSLAGPDAHQKKKYVLVPGNKDVSPDDLQFKEYGALIAKSLSENGFVPSPPEKADIFIGLSYTIGVAGQTHSSYMNTYTPPARDKSNPFVLDFGTTSTSSIHTKSRNIYSRSLSLVAVEAKAYREEKKFVQVWTASATSNGRSGNLREVFPAMALAIKPFIAAETKQTEIVTIDIHDREFVEFMEK